MFRREISLEYPCKKQQKGNTLKCYEKYPCAQLQESYILFIFSLFLFHFIFILKYKVIFSNCFSIIFFRWRTNWCSSNGFPRWRGLAASRTLNRLLAERIRIQRIGINEREEKDITRTCPHCSRSGKAFFVACTVAN